MSDKKKTLEAEDIVATPTEMGRRGALGVVGATILGTAAAAVIGVATPGKAAAANDTDSGPNADPAGQPRGRRRRSGVTDSDSGPNADTGGNGRGNGSDPARTSGTDRGPNQNRGANADPRQISDSD
jgi:hypothetical protein